MNAGEPGTRTGGDRGRGMDTEEVFELSERWECRRENVDDDAEW